MVKVLHSSIAVRDLDASIAFYRDRLGFKLQLRREVPASRIEIAFVGAPESEARIELIHETGRTIYPDRSRWDHLALEIEDVEALIRKLKAEGVKIEEEPHILSGTTTKRALIRDPDGVWIELAQST